MAYSKQTWDTTSYVNPTRMNHIEDGIYDASTATGTEYSSGVSVKDKLDDVDLTSGGTIDGNLEVLRDNRYGIVAIGKGSNSNEYGILQLYDKASHLANIRPLDNLGGNRNYNLPYRDGILLTDRTGIGFITSSSDSASVTFNCDSQTMYLVVAGVVGGNGSYFLSPSVFLVWRPTNGGTDVGYSQLVNSGRTISSATISGENVTLNFSGIVRCSIYRLCTRL